MVTWRKLPLNDGEVYVNIADENASHTLMCRDQLEVPNDETRRVLEERRIQVFNDDTKLFEEMLINHKYPNYPFANKDACESRHFRQTFGADNIIHRECLNELDFCNKDADGDTYNWSKNSSISYAQNPNGATKEEICASCTSNDASVKALFRNVDGSLECRDLLDSQFVENNVITDCPQDSFVSEDRLHCIELKQLIRNSYQDPAWAVFKENVGESFYRFNGIADLRQSDDGTFMASPQN